MIAASSVAPVLAKHRADIDRLDLQLLELLDQRMRTCIEIAKIKRDNEIPMMAPDRLKLVQDRCRSFADERGIDRDYLTDLFNVITAESCRVENLIIGKP